MSNNTENILENYKKSEKEKEEKIKKVVEEFSSDSDMEEESIHYEKFAQEGSEAIKVMTGFTINEFMELFSVVEKKLRQEEEGKRQN